MSEIIKHPLLEEFIDLSVVNAILPDTDSTGQPRVMFLLLRNRPKREIVWEFESIEVRNHFLEQIKC